MLLVSEAGGGGRGAALTASEDRDPPFGGSGNRNMTQEQKIIWTNDCNRRIYRVAFRKKIYRAIEELQADLNARLREYNERRPQQSRWCFGKTQCRPFSTSNSDDPADEIGLK